ncbi:MAG: helix-turn-helix domain-containing protein, partial [Clostridiales bacterium]|nr:helix-turn-helix domain-containing protein [Clostridiales bacterium]
GLNDNSRNGFFDIPMKLTDLAKYLHVDRSAMMREIRRMKSDGLIEGGNGSYRML